MTPRRASTIVRGELNRLAEEDEAMEPMLMPDTKKQPDKREEILVHEWRAERLRELGLPRMLADRFADRVDWRAVATLVARGCPPELALDIVR